MRARTCLKVLSLVLLAGCGARHGCPADFALFGEQEAREGRKASLPNPQCQPDVAERDRYFTGRGTGTRWFCDGPRLFEAARLGRMSDIQFCPLDLRDTALVAQRTGEELHKAQARSAAAAAKVRSAQQAGRMVEASEAELEMRVADADLEQLRGLAIERGWLPNPAVSGTLPDQPPPLLARPPGLGQAPEIPPELRQVPTPDSQPDPAPADN